MNAMILAAGLGTRMRPLTDHHPKPLLKVAGKALIEYHLEALARASIGCVVINTHWLAEQFPEQLGDGSRWGLEIHYSHEPEVLETAGGILNALPLLGGDHEPFLVLNGDVYCEVMLSAWLREASEWMESESSLAHLALISNPFHNLSGDFSFKKTHARQGLLQSEKREVAYTFSGIALYRKEFFQGLECGKSALGPLLRARAAESQVTASVIDDYWLDVGTPERLATLDARLAK